MSESIISHQGVVTGITKDKLLVSIIAQSACATCHAKGYCGVSEIEEKVVEVPRTPDYEHKKGDFVKVTMKRSMGLTAVLYGYIIPFVVLLITLLVISAVTGNEAVAGLVSLGILVPYYAVLYALRGKLQTRFQFEIEPVNSDTNHNF